MTYVIVDPGPGHRVVITTGWDSHHTQVPTRNSLLQQLSVKNHIEWSGGCKTQLIHW